MSSGYPKSTKAYLEAEKEIANRVDIVLYTARNLEEHVMSLAPKKAVYFSNGVNYLHFAKGSNLPPPEFEGIKHPIALYVGAMNEWFDYELINSSAKELPNISFVLIGPSVMARKRLERLPNIHILGPRPYNDLPRYMYNSDVGLIPFDLHNHTDLVNSIKPLKLYEYMACGLPVLAVEWNELKREKIPVILYKNREDFNKSIEIICYQKPFNKRALQKFAQRHDWGRQIKLLYGLITK